MQGTIKSSAGCRHLPWPRPTRTPKDDSASGLWCARKGRAGTLSRGPELLPMARWCRKGGKPFPFPRFLLHKL